jgi:hypothetical protein
LDFILHSHRFGLELAGENPLLGQLWGELKTALESLTDERVAGEFQTDVEKTSQMSLSKTINRVLAEELGALGWTGESAIFQDPEYLGERRWRLDFSKVLVDEHETRRGIAVEVAFNHGEAIAWNLLKPVLASELNHVKKQIDIGSGIGVVVAATESLKESGGFDSAVGSFEKFLTYLKPLQNQLTVPMIIVGLEAPRAFRIAKVKDPRSGRNTGHIEFS